MREENGKIWLDDITKTSKDKGLQRDAVSHLYSAWVEAERSQEARYVPRIRFLIGLCGLMLGDVHTRKLHLAPFIEDATARKTKLEAENSASIEMYSTMSAAEASLIDRLINRRAVKNVFVVCRPQTIIAKKGKRGLEMEAILSPKR